MSFICSQTIYIEKNRHWLPASGRDTRERLNVKFIGRLTNAIGPAFLVGIDRVIAQMACTDLEDFVSGYEALLAGDAQLADTLQSLGQRVQPTDDNGPTSAAAEQFSAKQLARFSNKILARFVAWTMNIGRLQLLRNEFRLELNQMCRVSSQQLEASLKTLNGAIMHDLSARKSQLDGSDTATDRNGGDNNAGGVPDTQMLGDLNEYLLYAGLHNPLHKVYVLVAPKTARTAAAFLFVLVVRTLERVSPASASNGHQELDDAPFVVGVATVLRQLHADCAAGFVELMCRFVTLHMRLSIR